MQIIIVSICIAIAAGYAAWRIFSVFSVKKNPCANCQGCALKTANLKNQKNQPCDKKKAAKNLAVREKSINFASAN